MDIDGLELLQIISTSKDIIMILNKFKVPIYDNGIISRPYFNEKRLQYSAELKDGYFEITIANISGYRLDQLKEKYIWLGETILEVEKYD